MLPSHKFNLTSMTPAAKSTPALVIPIPRLSRLSQQYLQCIIAILYLFDVLGHGSVRANTIFVHNCNQLILRQQFRGLFFEKT